MCHLNSYLSKPFELTLDHFTLVYLICGKGGNPGASRVAAEKIHPPNWNSLTSAHGRVIWVQECIAVVGEE